MIERKGTILIVDDEKNIRQLLYQRLKSEGHCCKEAGSAAQALAKMQAEPVDLALLDIRMRGTTMLFSWQIIEATKILLRSFAS